MSNQALTVVQSNYEVLAKAKGFDAFVRLFELAGNDPDMAKNLAEKEAYHLAQLMTDSEDLRNMPPGSLMMEMRKIPLQGVSLDPTLKLAYLMVQDKAKGRVELVISGRGKAVQAMAQNIIKNVDATVIFDGDKTAMDGGIIKVIPAFKPDAKVIGGILTIQWPDGRLTQEFYRQSHILSWQARSAKRFGGYANKNYTSFNGGCEPGFLLTKMLKHKLDRAGIAPFAGAYRKVKRETIDNLPDDLSGVVMAEDADVVDVTTDERPQDAEQSTGQGNSVPPAQQQAVEQYDDLNNLEL